MEHARPMGYSDIPIAPGAPVELNTHLQYAVVGSTAVPGRLGATLP